MKSFDIHRFWNLLKLDLYPKGLTMSLGVACGVSVPIALVYYLMLNRPSNNFDLDAGGAFTMGILLSCFLMSPFFFKKGWKAKKDRISFMMIPASNLEKFLDRMIFSSVILTLGALSAIVLSNLLFYIAMSFKVGLVNASCPWIYAIKGISGNIFSSLAEIILMHAFFTLGSILFKAKGWLITLLLFGISIYSISQVSNLVEWTIIGRQFEFSINDTDTIGTFICIILSVIFYYLSYCSFKRMQVVNNGLINV